MKKRITMRRITTYTILLISFFLVTCENAWNDHYSSDTSLIDKTIWEEINSNAEYSEFRNYIVDYGLESYFIDSDTAISSKTVFIPTNSAFQSYTDNSGEVTESVILYHLIKSYFLFTNIDGNLKSLTQNAKFLYFEENVEGYFVDGIKVSDYTERYKDGIIYKMSEVLAPKPSIAEYINENAEYFGNYIKSFDTIYMDYTQSELIGFDDDGNPVYDSVYNIYNEFKEKYFNVDYNTRDTFATLLLYTDEQFYKALDDVADSLGYISGRDLPVKWIEEVYFEYYLRNAFFDGLLTWEDFTNDFVINILGDTVSVEYWNLNQEQIICSNGLIYQYKELVIPPSLYQSEARTEGESLVYTDIDGKLAFNEAVNFVYKDEFGDNQEIKGNISYVLAEGIASKDSAIQISIGANFNGTFELEVPLLNVFPGRYILDWAGFSTVSGVYKVYVNDNLLYTRLPFEPASDPGSIISEFDSYNFGNFTLEDLTQHENGIDWSKLRASNSSWNINEFYVESDPSDPNEFYLKEFGDVIVRFEFVNPSPSNSLNTGIVLDYLNLRQR